MMTRPGVESARISAASVPTLDVNSIGTKPLPLPPSPCGLPDSHIMLVGVMEASEEVSASLSGLELEPSLEHDDRARLAV
ncbi:MAG: hypothetical protein ACRC67_15550, partial [Inquilinus sp.]|uniref:hypothetical protein n=1 Tax=Inquilinus sp. TaxID=1932117 RepID=UPI003F2A9CDC